MQLLSSRPPPIPLSPTHGLRDCFPPRDSPIKPLAGNSLPLFQGSRQTRRLFSFIEHAGMRKRNIPLALILCSLAATLAFTPALVPAFGRHGLIVCILSWPRCSTCTLQHVPTIHKILRSISHSNIIIPWAQPTSGRFASHITVGPAHVRSETPLSPTSPLKHSRSKWGSMGRSPSPPSTSPHHRARPARWPMLSRCH